MNSKILTESRFPWRRRPRLRCESMLGRLNSSRDGRATGSARGIKRTAAVSSGGGGRLAEGHLVAERFELTLQPASAVFGRVALALPIGAELAKRDLIA